MNDRFPMMITLDQVCFGVEIVSTGGADVTFTFTDFSIRTAAGAAETAEPVPADG